MTTAAVPDGFYRIRQAGAKSDIANLISNGKKCHYVQIGLDLANFDSLESAMEFVEGKGLKADPMSLDFGKKPDPPEEKEEDAAAEATDSETTDS